MSVKHRTVLASALLLVGAGVTFAQEPPRPQGPPEPQAPGMMRRMGPPFGLDGAPEVGMFQPARLINRRQMLDLTPDQVSRLEALAQEAQQARARGDSVARGQAEQFRELWKAPAPDVAQIRSRAQAAMQARQTAALASLEAAAKAKAVLTAEQRGRVAGWADGARMRAPMQMRMQRPMDGPRQRAPGPGPMRMRMRRGMRG